MKRPGPDFAGFAEALREEARWVGTIHRGDKTGQAQSDIDSLHRLAEKVELVGRQLGFIGPKPEPAKAKARFDWSAQARCPECGEQVQLGRQHVCYGGLGEDVDEAFIDPDIGDR